jgi:phosphatidylglycerol lysyltransferase
MNTTAVPSPQPHAGWGRARWLELVPAALGLLIFTAALEVLRLEARTISWDALTTDIAAVPGDRLLLAIALTIANYVVLTAYDLLAFAYVGRRLPTLRVLLTSFLAYAVANNISFATLSGASVRYRFYSRWGVTLEELTRVVFAVSVTFWLGLFLLGGLSLLLAPPPATLGVPAWLTMSAGWVLVLLPPVYVTATLVRRTPFRVRQLSITLPSPAVALTQLCLSVADWLLAGAVLYALLPAGRPPFLLFMGAFLAALLIGLVSHVPGGVGVFEGLMVLLLRPFLDSRQLLPALVVYRVVYYLLPLAVAALVLVGDELRQRRHALANIGTFVGRLSEQFTPIVLASFTFLAGVVLLFSGATPAESHRLALAGRILPIAVIETSHLLASVAGAGLLVLSQGLARRLDVAYYLTASLMAMGMATSLLKGFDYEEAAVVGVVLLLLRGGRRAFTRRAAFFQTRFSASWTAAVLGAVLASVWLGLFAFQHVEYSRDLWWQFELRGDASRFLRASVGVGVVLLLVALARLLGYAPHEMPSPSDTDLDDARRIIDGQVATAPNLAFLRDKALLFDDERTAFLMYGVQGRTWVALGDPTGPPDRLNGVIRLFLERCRDFGGTPVFYEVTPEQLHRFADFGLTFVKLGEEAHVDLQQVTLEGSRGSKFRQIVRRLERDQGTFRMIDPGDVPAVLNELRSVSDDWLAAKSAGEKGFSLGFFDETYLQRFPIAVIERRGRIEAFANVWCGGGRRELSVDLMRHRTGAPNGVMEALFVHLMLWGRQQRYEWFSLGIAPLSGFEQSPVAPLWNRLGAFLYKHGGSLYNFQGLRTFKDKFNPVWQPRYLAWPGGLRLPRILADISALIAGGYARVLRR